MVSMEAISLWRLQQISPSEEEEWFCLRRPLRKLQEN
jgi:hypothetical protein